MLWLDLIDIVFLLVGVILGYIICVCVSKDVMQDVCDNCEYHKFMEDILNDRE